MTNQPKNPMQVAGSSSENERGNQPNRGIAFPRPTADEKSYLEELKQSAEKYDASVVIGGPKST